MGVITCSLISFVCFSPSSVPPERRSTHRDGIRQHRRIDAFTDTHPSVAAFRRVLIPEHGHYARVISDVFFDHFLATSWGQYSRESLERFLRRTWAAIDPHQAELPGLLAFVYPLM